MMAIDRLPLGVKHEFKLIRDGKKKFAICCPERKVIKKLRQSIKTLIDSSTCYVPVKILPAQNLLKYFQCLFSSSEKGISTNL